MQRTLNSPLKIQMIFKRCALVRRLSLFRLGVKLTIAVSGAWATKKCVFVV